MDAHNAQYTVVWRAELSSDTLNILHASDATHESESWWVMKVTHHFIHDGYVISLYAETATDENGKQSHDC